MIEKVVQVATFGKNSKPVGKVRSVLDKDSKTLITYQNKVKQYIGDVAKYKDSIEKCFSTIIR